MDVPGSTRASWSSLLAVAAAYAACYEITRHFSFSHWNLLAGLRLACLIRVPRRYWLALAIGETLPVAEGALLHLQQFGIGWTVFAGLPIIALCMPVVALAQRRSPVYGPQGEINMGKILALTLACAAIDASVDDLALVAALTSAPGKWPDLNATSYFFAYFLGSFLGALTLTPALLTLRERVGFERPIHFADMKQSAFVHDMALMAVPLLLAVAVIAPHLEGWALQVCRLGTCVPVVVLTLRRGWHGAALAGLLASVALASTSVALLDPPMIQAQVVLAFVLSCALWIGVPIHRRLQLKEQNRLTTLAALT